MRLKPLTVIGLNSGTSMDGVDAGIFRICPPVETGKPTSCPVPALAIESISARTAPYEPDLVKFLKRLAAGDPVPVELIARLNAALGEAFSQAAIRVMRAAGVGRQDVDLVGSHGQTLWHAPAERQVASYPTRGSLQLGEPAIIAARTGIPVIADFRVQDMALGGQGAPLSAFADAVLFTQERQPVGVLNLGGIANLTVIDRHGQAVMAFDTGPGNMVIDRACECLFGLPFDEGGRLAAAGCTDSELLARAESHPFFARRPPKTTGREDFGAQFSDGLLASAAARGISTADCLHTFTRLTAAAVASAYRRFVHPQIRLDRLVLGGGGAENRFLVKLLYESWPHPVTILKHEDFGVSSRFKESLLFALLAYTTWFRLPNNIPECTGASARVCLGKLVMP